MQEKMQYEYRRWRAVNRWIDRVILTALAVFAAFAVSGLTDSLKTAGEGLGGVEYHSFSELRRINPDTAAWLILDGTHIDHPVVKSSDNFDYLDRDFEGRSFAGGTLFMDKDNSGSEDPYCMIHGHNMAAGAMFGDLDRYLDPDFFDRNRSGTLLTPEYDYDIKVFAAGVFDAYDSRIYRTGQTVPSEYIAEKAVNVREADAPGHVLALSTCSDDMTDNRVVVFCSLENRRKHK